MGFNKSDFNAIEPNGLTVYTHLKKYENDSMYMVKFF